MTKHEEYNLVFYKLNFDGKDECLVKSSTTDSLTKALAFTLMSMHTSSLNEIYENITFYNNGFSYWEKDFITTEGGGDSYEVKILPPNMLFKSGDYQIPLIDFKLILDEWVEFAALEID